MMKRTALSLAAASALGALSLSGCADSNDEDIPRLEFNAGFPSELAVGDTTDAFAVTKVFLNPLGREEERDTYLDFHFVSSDTSVVKVVEKRRLLGVKTGTAEVRADDEQARASTPSANTVTVK